MGDFESNQKQTIHNLELTIATLREELAAKENLLKTYQNSKDNLYNKDLSTEEISRYSRQMLIPQIGLNGQIALKKSKILIIGLGGLGCPASLYLAAAGVGELVLVDYDSAEVTNLHRQILHTEADIEVPKVVSAAHTLKSINHNIKVTPVQVHANGDTLEEIVKTNNFDVIIDGSDNVATRYLINDVCVMNNVPLVSGSALQLEGQLTVYHYENGPCYRCLFPVPPPAHTVTNCGDGGVLGPVPGVIGVLQALEAIKIITKAGDVLSERLLLFDGATSVFRNIKLRPKNPKCDVCGENPKITSLIDYEQFCGAKAHDKVINIDILNDDDKVKVTKLREGAKNKLIVDVRPEIEFSICSLPNTVNVPYSLLQTDRGIEQLRQILKANDNKDVYVLCRRGNDSQRAVALLKKTITDTKFYNVEGGLHAYAKYIDNSFPVY